MAKIHFLNVDEGDCSIIQHDNGSVTMIDICCGNIQEKIQPFTTYVQMSTFSAKGNFNQKAYPTNPVEYLKRKGIKSIFRYIQSHPDMDHMDGLKRLNDSIRIVNFWDTANTKQQDFDQNGKSGRYLKEDWECYQSLRKSKDGPKALFYYDGSTNKYYAEDDKGKLTDDYLRILAPTPGLLEASEKAKDWNDSSYVILYSIQGRKILFCGDAEMGTINHLTQKHLSEIADIDVLIAPHHGRDSDKDFTFLDVMKPKLTLIGNAKSAHLAYNEWNNRGLGHIQNNQGGNILIEIKNGEIHVSCSNHNYADAFCQGNFKNDSVPNETDKEYWRLFYL